MKVNIRPLPQSASDSPVTYAAVQMCFDLNLNLKLITVTDVQNAPKKYFENTK